MNSNAQRGHSAAAAADFPLVGLFLINPIALRLDLPDGDLDGRVSELLLHIDYRLNLLQ